MYPPFYLTRKAVSSNDLPNVISSSLNVTGLVKVRAFMTLSESWKTGQYPQKVVFTIYYLVKSKNEIEILDASLEYSEFTSNGKSVYDFIFSFQALTWLDCFDLNAFDISEYVILLLLLPLSLLIIMLLAFVISFLMCPVDRKLRGQGSCGVLIVNCIKGYSLMIIPTGSVLAVSLSILMNFNFLKYIPADFTDKNAISDLNSSTAWLYLSSRAGIIFMVTGLLMIK